METCLQHRTCSDRSAAARNFAADGCFRFSDDKDLLRVLFPEPHMRELVSDLTYAVSEVERFLSTI